jgi:hypothetical protein
MTKDKCRQQSHLHLPETDKAMKTGNKKEVLTQLCLPYRFTPWVAI